MPSERQHPPRSGRSPALWLFAAMACTLCTCAGSPGVLVNIGPWPQGAETLRIRSTLRNVRGSDQILARGQTQFAVYVPDEDSGKLHLEITALDRQRCKVAEVQLQPELGSGLRPLSTAAATLEPVYPARCQLTSVSAGPSGHAWAVGVDGTVLQCDGAACFPSASGTSYDLTAVSVGSNGEAWAVGLHGTVLRCKGSSCAAIPNRTPSDLTAVSASLSEAWAVGANGTVLRCTESGCAQITGGPTRNLTAVSANDFGEAVVVGARGAVLRCNSVRCYAMVSGSSDDLVSVSVHKEQSGDEVALLKRGGALQCGEYGCSAFLGTDRLESVDIKSGHKWIVGERAVLHCSGSTCPPLYHSTSSYLRSVRAHKDGKIAWAVGDAGAVLQCTETCSAVSSGTTDNLTSVGVDNAGHAWALGTSGTVLACSGVGCSSIYKHPEQTY